MNSNNLSEDLSLGEDFNQDFDVTFIDLDNDGTFETVAQAFDTDGDAQPDTWVIQSDIDSDSIADQTSVIQGFDTNEDGQIDTWEIQTDLNGDLVPDEIALAADTDSDGLPDTLTEQWDGDDERVIGEPTSDMEHWHQQTYDDTCAVSCQEFILDELTGRDFTENELRQEAMENGWYTPGGGTPMECMGNLLEAHGIDVERQSGCNIEDLSEKLAQGENVMVALDADEIWNPGGIDEDDQLANVFGMPGQDANHAVQVIGIDTSDPDNPMVILNDPGSPNGQGLRVPADDFMNAWEDSGYFTVYTTGQSVQTERQGAVEEAMIGGYYNADETYHYTSYDLDLPPDY